ncbi:MAG: carboxypeptidase regulatory-like domain-containing protein [Gemmatimonadota bacterium]
MRLKRLCGRMGLLILALGLLPGVGAAQSVTTATVSGRVTGPDGTGVTAVEVVVTNLATGFTKATLTGDNGVYVVPGLQVGGPYRVSVSALGYATQERSGFTLTLGQNLSLTFQLAVQAVQLEGLEVTATATREQVINPARTGAEQLVTENQLRTLPTITRNFTDFIALSPLTSGASVGGQNNRFNNIQIDGAVSQDLFGLGATGQPGGQAGARSISIEAVKEYQVLVAPYDVRQSGFTGGLINAVTKSGTNDVHGSAYAYYRNESFLRETLDVRGQTFSAPGEFTNRLLGATVGGPLVRDKVHYFLSGEFETQDSPAGGLALGRDPVTQTGIADADAARFVQLLQSQGASAGEGGPFTVENPNRNLFARIDAQLNANHVLTLRHNYVRAEDDVTVNRFPGSNYSFDSNFYFFGSTTNSSVAQLNSQFGKYYNELTFGRTDIEDRRTPRERFPVVQVSVPNQAGTGTKRLIAGAEFFSQGNELDQTSWEITDNVTFSAGDHRLTFGAQSQWYSFRNLFAPGITGEWTFNSLDDLAAGTPSSYRRGVPYRPGLDLNARFTVNQLSAYGQTEWTVRPNVVFTAGLRYDVPLVGDKPEANADVAAAFGRSTDEVPSGNGIISPRLGFNWDVFEDQSLQVRGGAGIFTGRYPYVWLSNLYSNTGRFQVTINCSASGSNMPAYTLDPDNQPTTCAAGGTPAPPLAVINVVDPDFQWPHAWRFNLGADKQLPYGLVATADFLYTKSAKQILLRELNVNFASPVTTTQGGRPVFGTIAAGAIADGADNRSVASPNRINSTAGLAVVELGNSDQDRSWSSTLQLQKRYADGYELNGSYTYARAEDLSGLTSSIATSNIGFNPVQGSPNDPVLSTSDYETRHKVVLSGLVDLGQYVSWSWFYIGNSGGRYSYVYDGDVNADGFEASYASNRFNDLLYVPSGPGDITLTDPADWNVLNAFIESEACLAENRGQILTRNVCQGPWQNRVDTRFTFKVPTVTGQRAEITLDVFNVLNLLNQSWGISEGPQFAGLDLLQLRGWDTANNRGIFRPTGRLRLDDDGNADPLSVFDLSSRWQMQLGVRYAF